MMRQGSSMRRRIVRLSAMAAALGILSACGSSAGVSSGGYTLIPIGADFSLTGDFSQYDQPGYQGMEIAINQINQTGFVVDGKKYKFKVYATDNQSDIATGVTQARSLVNDDKIVALFGPVVSPIAVPVAAVTQSSRVLEFTPSIAVGADLHTSPSKYPYMIVTEPPTGGPNGVATVESRVVGKQLHARTVAVLQPADATGEADQPAIVEGFEEAGAKIVYNQTFPDSTTDFSPYIQKLAALHPDVLVVGYTDAEMIPMITEARQLGAAKYYVGLGSENPALKSGTTALTNYFWFLPVVGQEDTQPAMTKFVAAFKKFTGQSPTTDFGYAVNMYPWPFALVKAMQQAKSVTNVHAIESRLRNVTLSFAGKPVSKIAVGSDGQAYPPYEWCDLLSGVNSPRCTQESATSGSS